MSQVKCTLLTLVLGTFAFAFGTRGDANDGYKYAKGEPIKNFTTGEMMQKQTPYDWAAVTDHAEYLGMMNTPGQQQLPQRTRKPSADLCRMALFCFK